MGNETKIIISAETAQADSALRSLGSSVESLKSKFSSLSGITATFAGTLSITAFSGFIKHTIDAADRMNDLSKATGISVEELAGFNLLAKQNGLDLDGLAKGINKMSVEIGKSPEKFAALGVTSKDNAKAFAQFADIFNQLPDIQQRNALAQAVFQKSWQEMAPALSEGGKKILETVEKGTRLSKVTNDMGVNADQFNDSMDELNITLGATSKKIVGDMLRPLNQVADAMKEAAKEGGLLKTLWVGLGAVGSALYTDEFMSDANKAKKQINELQAEIGQFERNKQSGGGLLQKWLFGTDDEINKKIDATKEKLAKAQADLAAILNPPSKPKPVVDTDAQAKATRKAAEFLSTSTPVASDFYSFRKRLLVDLAPQDEDGKTTRASKLQVELDLDKTITAQERVKLQTLIDQVAAQDKITAAKKSERQGLQVMLGLGKDYQNELEKRTEALNAPLLSASERQLAEDMRATGKRAQDARIELEKMNISGSLSASDYQKRLQEVTAKEGEQKAALRALRGEQDKMNASWQYGAGVALRTYLDEIENVAKQSEHLFTNAFKGMEDALVSFVKTGKLDFKSLADSIITELIRIQVKQSVMQPMMGGIGGFLGSIFGGSGAGSASVAAAAESDYMMLLTAHTGGIVGSEHGSTFAHPSVFSGAPRFHTGGLVGDEVPIIAKRGEGVFTPGQMKALGGSTAAPNVVVQVINQSGQQVSAKQQGGPQFDGRDWVLGIVLEAADSNPHFRNAMGMA